ncbi:probable calcium-binding protein CML22 [Typha latifolia]|uniref:probable calcium-binding protein CML22 n=1 Tax=Typha latifolia TaxID=4733 RepID=UPI003C2C7403
MKEASGFFHPCHTLKALFYGTMSSAIPNFSSSVKCGRQYVNLEKKVVEAIKERRKSRQKTFRSLNSIIMRFPQFKEQLKSIKDVFERYDEDSNGTIDHQELKKCFTKLQIHLSEKEIDAMYHYCNIDGKKGIQQSEFIVLLCLIYLLMKPASASHNNSEIGLPQLNSTFDTLVEAFLFLDKNGDGKLEREDVVLALNEESPKEKSLSRITARRFNEMDWNKDGKVDFKEFVFSLTKWVGIESDDEEEEHH